ncbi:glycosyl hydrolase [Thalassotalea sp. M1531]|uniref:Beta-D-glucoside glucohydrolase n=1 Tax=Thalassotalea algicola TaxID=2716224 RepID=A0A7Y0Q611_9GAMM|nr:glycoside hydrolase family 3 C-terminal domain-containing protein [Thalassotalea algicola]NMP31519.1 glycosyl hydrolase [Thalassotalea algicola]
MNNKPKVFRLFAIFCGLLGLVAQSFASPEKRNDEVVERKVQQLIAKMTLAEKISMVHASGKFHVNAIPRLGIPELWLSDGPHGVRYQIERDSWSPAGWDNDYSTYLPHLTSVAASWDPEMASLHGHVLGAEARDRQKDIILGPGVNLARLPLYGRNFEYMGEDPFLAASLVVPVVKAIQSHDVAANAKHYALNTQELNRIGVNAMPDERTLREVYLPAFEAAVKQGGVYSIMGAYNEYFGTNANQSKHLVKEILKQEWGFDGVLLTDWNVDINTYDAAMNGLDLEMGTEAKSYDDYYFAKPLLNQIKAGKIPEHVLDDKVSRVLRLMYRVGLFDKNRKQGQRNTKTHQLNARKIAEAGVVLLKNTDNVLPLSNSVKSVLVLGPNADKIHGLGGGSSEVKTPYEITPLQGLNNKLGNATSINVMRAKSAGVMPIAADYISSRHWTGTPAWTFKRYADATNTQLVEENWIVNCQYKASDNTVEQYIEMSASISPKDTGKHIFKVIGDGQLTLSVNGKQVLHEQLANGDVVEYQQALTVGKQYQVSLSYVGKEHFTIGLQTPNALFTEESIYLAAAKEADAVIYVGGLTHADDREAIDRSDMKLPGNQDEVIAKLLKTNPNTVILLVAGSAVEMPWAEQAKAIVWGWYGGMEAGNAFANVLFGDVNPSGKMPIVLPKNLAQTAPIMLNDYNAQTSKYSEGVFIGHRWLEKQSLSPLFPFGHGLSYTQFSYGKAQLSAQNFTKNKPFTVTLPVTNTGKKAGSEVVQLYLQDVEASVQRPIKELKGFKKVYLLPGETKLVSIDLTLRDLSFWHTGNNDWLAERGQFIVHLGASHKDIRQVARFTLN